MNRIFWAIVFIVLGLWIHANEFCLTDAGDPNG